MNTPLFPQGAIGNAFSRWLKKPEDKKETAAPVVQPKREAAALSLDVPNQCPYCKSTMTRTTAVGIDVYLCDQDRYVAPCENEVTPE